MKLKKILVVVGILGAFAFAGEKEVSKEEFKGKWPLTVEKAVLECKNMNGIEVPFVVANGKKYGLSGFANRFADGPLQEIWAKNPKLPGTYIDISPLREKALELCK